MSTRIAVIESRCWKNSNASIRGLFDLIADINFDNPNQYHYEMAMSAGTIKETIPRIAADGGCKYLYIATHGDTGGLHLYNGEKLSREDLRRLFRSIHEKPGSRITGLHLGSCLFATDELAAFMYERPVGLRWIAGYTEEVSWIESSALDLLFFNELIKYDAGSDLQNIKDVAERLRTAAAGLIEELGFGIFVRERGGIVRDLLENSDIDDLEDIE